RDFHVTGVQTCALPIFSDASAAGIAANRRHRAIAGLSMGGMQVLNLVFGGYRCDSVKYTENRHHWDNGLDTTVRAPGMTDLFARSEERSGGNGSKASNE